MAEIQLFEWILICFGVDIILIPKLTLFDNVLLIIGKIWYGFAWIINSNAANNLLVDKNETVLKEIHDHVKVLHKPITYFKVLRGIVITLYK